MPPDFPADLTARINPADPSGMILSMADLRARASGIEVAIDAALAYELRHREQALAVLNSGEQHEDIVEIAGIERMTEAMIDRLHAFRARLRDSTDMQDVAFDYGFASRIFKNMPCAPTRSGQIPPQPA